jgi:predicted  nucleic acid-binding Zn-ribbon protein
MARKFFTPIDLNGLEIQNVRIQNLASAPGNPSGPGQIYFNTTNNTLYVYDGAAWQADGKLAAGSTASRPSAGSAGRLYFSTDENVLYYDNGTTWAKAGVKQSDFDGLDTRVGTAESDITSLQGRMSTAEGDISSQGGRLTTAEGNISSLQGDVSTLQSDVSGLGSRLTTAEGDISSQGGRLTTAEGNISTLQSDVSSLEGRVSTNESDISSLEGRVSTNESDISGLQSDVSSQGGRLSTAEGNISSLQSDLSSHTSATQNVHGISDTADLVYQSDLSSAVTDLQGYADTAASNAEQNAKDYADAIAQGLDVKASVRAATTANIVLSGVQDVDGVSVVANDRVLVQHQTDASENGIYVVAAGAWARAEDANVNADVTSGLFTFVEEGSLYGGNGYVLITANPINLGSTNLEFTQFSGLGAVEAGDGLSKTGNRIDVVAGTGIVVNANDVAIDTDVVARKVVFENLTATVGRSPVTITLAHNLDNRDVAVSVFDSSTYEDIVCDIARTTANAVELTVYVSGNFRAVVVG